MSSSSELEELVTILKSLAEKYPGGADQERVDLYLQDLGIYRAGSVCFVAVKTPG